MRRSKPEIDTLARLALASHGLTNELKLIGHAFIGRDDLVECVGDLASEAGLVARQATEKSPVRMACNAKQLMQAETMAVELTVASFEDGARDLHFAAIDWRGADVAVVIQVHD